jgi:hypothetical protein
MFISSETGYPPGGGHMEKILRFIGNVFLYVANAIHEAKDIADSFFFDILLEGNHLYGRTRMKRGTR